MADEKLKKYIYQNIQTISSEAIKKQLLTSGWPEKDIDEALKEVSNKDQTPTSNKTSVLAFWALIFAIIIPIIGIILGILSFIQINKNKNLKGKTLAIIAIVISFFSIFFLIFLGSFLMRNIFFNHARDYKQTIPYEREPIEPPVYEALAENAKTECKMLCDKISDEVSATAFCGRTFEVDWNLDGAIEGAATDGGWWFCEQKIPCFIIEPNCRNRYDGEKCRDLLIEFRRDIYHKLYLEVDGLPPENPEDFNDGCNLPDSKSENRTDFNWKERFCFSNTYSEVLGSGFLCSNASVS
jgi:hypothetical protein